MARSKNQYLTPLLRRKDASVLSIKLIIFFQVPYYSEILIRLFGIQPIVRELLITKVRPQADEPIGINNQVMCLSNV
ncbi:MAG TPA: hypothetical protein EYP59_16495 [Thiotrichaceae bacterium]|nr:hypothetical protein [Thiotrichaceae bacterium]